MLPRGHESEFFALFEIGDRGSSCLGPLIVGVMANVPGGQVRFGFIYVLVMMLAPVLAMTFLLNVSKGRTECELFVAAELALLPQNQVAESPSMTDDEKKTLL